MDRSATVAFAYGALLAIGGIIGYVGAGSGVSLAGGVGLGAAVAACGVAMRKGLAAGWWIAVVGIGILTVYLLYRSWVGAGGVAWSLTVLSALAVLLLLRDRPGAAAG